MPQLGGDSSSRPSSLCRSSPSLSAIEMPGMLLTPFAPGFGSCGVLGLSSFVRLFSGSADETVARQVLEAAGVATKG